METKASPALVATKDPWELQEPRDPGVTQVLLVSPVHRDWMVARALMALLGRTVLKASRVCLVPQAPLVAQVWTVFQDPVVTWAPTALTDLLASRVREVPPDPLVVLATLANPVFLELLALLVLLVLLGPRAHLELPVNPVRRVTLVFKAKQETSVSLVMSVPLV